MINSKPRVTFVAITDQCAPCYGYRSVSGDAKPPLNTTEQLRTRACGRTVDYGGYLLCTLFMFI